MYFLQKYFTGIFLLPLCSLFSVSVIAGGISLSGTRLIIPADSHQATMSVRNTSDKSSFLVQSWVENAQGQKTSDFIVTPPLYVSGPENENTLRLMYTGAVLPVDHETLYYLNVKSIPSMDRKKLDKQNVLLVAAVTRIKLFVRPRGLKPSVEQAPSELSFHRAGKKIRIDNPTPYYITLVLMKAGERKLDDIMVPPRGSVSEGLPEGSGSLVSFRAMNDYGSASSVVSKEIQ